jgi:diguanylate cyclase (GGDEF)-like protein
MNLNKRALILIAPVVIVSYLVAMVGVYQMQKRVAMRLELSRAELQMANLKSSYLQYTLKLDGIMHAIREGTVLRSFLDDPQDIHRYRALTSLLDDIFPHLQAIKSKTIAVSIINAGKVQEFYYESSLEPFSNVDPGQLAFAIEQIDTPEIHKQKLVGMAGDSPLLIMQERFDRRTFREALSRDVNHTVLLQVAMSPDDFLAELLKIQETFKASVALSEEPPFNRNGQHVQTNLSKHLYATLEVHEASLLKELDALQWWLLAGLSITAVTSFALLFWLIRRFITHPIQLLEQHLNVALQEGNARVERIESNDEVGRLSARFAETYEALSLAYEKARYLSEVDVLTGLPNRTFFAEWIKRLLSSEDQLESRLALLYIDLDHFKAVNDKYGHQTGDALLQKFSLRLKRTVARFIEQTPDAVESFAARLAGDEFALAVKGDNVLQHAEALSAEILALFDNGFAFERGVFAVTSSIGVAIYPRDGSNLNQLILNADAAMYQAKAAGRNRLATFSSLLAESARRLQEIESHLKQGRIYSEFRLVFMPIVDAVTGKAVGFEALLRWHSEELGLVGPDEFIPIAERTGCIEKIDKWVVNEALQYYSRLSSDALPEPRLCINLSGGSLKSERLLEHIQDATKASGIPPRFIEFEMTETYDVDFTLEGYSQVTTLRKAGYRFSIDDFGAGYTSLSKMAEFPVDTIKLDREFINCMLASERLDILAMLVQLGHSMQMTVVAEGVEDELAADLMRQIGCDYLQGYFFGRPCPAEELCSGGKLS